MVPVTTPDEFARGLGMLPGASRPMAEPGQPQRFIEHRTAAGERWDLLAWEFYGDATHYAPIITANPSVPIEPVFEAGVKLAVPILDRSEVLSQDMPPWKR